MLQRSLLLCLLMGIATSLVTAQKDFKFGKIDQADLDMKELASDTSAGAYVLHHSNFIFFNLSGTPLMMQTVNRRVKLLKRSGFNEADIEIYYRPRSEKVTTLKAAIHLPNGKQIKLKNSDFIREDYSDEVRVVKFTFPQVTEGAIIEYTYRKSDEAFTYLPEFYFQEDVPVRWSEYRAEIPEYFRYVNLSNSHGSWAESRNEVINGQVSGISMQVQSMSYAQEDMPAFKDEPYTNNLSDYLPKMYMQLQTVSYPRQAAQDVISTWPKLAKKLDDFVWFGRKFNSVQDVKKPLEDIQPMIATATSETEKALVAYRYIGQHMNWNGSYRISGDDRLNQCWDKASGNSAEINMILLGVLRALQIDAQPLLVSLRNRGAHIMAYPVFDQFDHLMVLATLDGKPMILDVNNPNRQMGLPRFEALNGFGWIANPVNPQWIEVNAPKMTETTVATIVLDEEGMGDVTVQNRRTGYYALSARDDIELMEKDDEGPLMEEIFNVFPDVEFVSREVDENENPYAPFGMILNAKIPLAQMADDYIYLNPVIAYPLNKGLVDTESRLTPVDFGYPSRHRYIAKVTIPTGYEVDEVPKGTRMRSEDGSVVVTYSATADESEVSLSYVLDINRATFTPDEYYALKEIFERAIELQESMFVFRKVE